LEREVVLRPLTCAFGTLALWRISLAWSMQLIMLSSELALLRSSRWHDKLISQSFCAERLDLGRCRAILSKFKCGGWRLQRSVQRRTPLHVYRRRPILYAIIFCRI